MKIPATLLTAALAGLSVTLMTSCEKEPLRASEDEQCDATCKVEGCTAPEKHQVATNKEGEYYCPPCGMG